MFPVIDSFATGNYTQMTAAEGRAFWGDNLSCDYTYDGVDYTATLQYQGTASVNSGNIENNSIFTTGTASSYDIIFYKGSSVAGRYGAIDNCKVYVPIYSASYVRGGFMARVSGQNTVPYPNDPVAVSNVIASYPNNYYGSSYALSANTAASSSLADYYNVFELTIPGGGKHNFRSILYEYDSESYETFVNFQSIQADYYGSIFFCIICPYYGDELALTTTATTTTTSSVSSVTTVNVNVNVDIDMDQTNGLLSQIKQGIDGLAAAIVNGLHNLFVPDDDFMEDWVSDMEDLLEDHLGGLYEAKDILVDFYEEFENVTASSTIDIPTCNIPLAGETLTLGGWSVPLKVQGLPQILYDGIAWITDFLCLMAFLRMCRKKLEIFLVPESEAIKE